MEETMTNINPKFIHDCKNCKLLAVDDKYDFYMCINDSIETLVARFDNPGPEYWSMDSASIMYFLVQYKNREPALSLYLHYIRFKINQLQLDGNAITNYEFVENHSPFLDFRPSNFARGNINYFTKEFSLYKNWLYQFKFGPIGIEPKTPSEFTVGLYRCE